MDGNAGKLKSRGQMRLCNLMRNNQFHKVAQYSLDC